MITETLSPSYFQSCHSSARFEDGRARLQAWNYSALEVAGCLISDSALKVVFSYYPVCRCQRTSHSRTFEEIKKPNLTADFESRFRLSLPGQN